MRARLLEERELSKRGIKFSHKNLCQKSYRRAVYYSGFAQELSDVVKVTLNIELLWNPEVRHGIALRLRPPPRSTQSRS